MSLFFALSIFSFLLQFFRWQAFKEWMCAEVWWSVGDTAVPSPVWLSIAIKWPPQRSKHNYTNLFSGWEGHVKEVYLLFSHTCSIMEDNVFFFYCWEHGPFVSLCALNSFACYSLLCNSMGGITQLNPDKVWRPCVEGDELPSPQPPRDTQTVLNIWRRVPYFNPYI